MTKSAYQAADIIQKAAPQFHPKIGLVLGSGLSGFADQLSDAIHIPYHALPSFPESTVVGHPGKLTLGHLKNTPIVCLQGRAHAYENPASAGEIVKTYVRTLKLLGCQYLLLTNASGSLHADMPPGSLMLITDHINLQSTNPLLGPNDEDFGPRFFSLDNVYQKSIRDHFMKTAETMNLSLHQGVYVSVNGPNYETAAEISAFKTMGADAVGMSTVPEVLVGAHCGLTIGAIATITNFATGLNSFSHSHDGVLSVAAAATESLTTLFTHALPTLP